MLFAHDYNNNRVYIDETHSNQEYYCPYCGVPLITKKGEKRQHHFAHHPSHHCSDSWVGERSHNYDTSDWHNEWQSLFPKDNQEVMLVLGDTKHRADVMIDKTVIEFQHSVMQVKAFDDRNNFYANFGNKVIWLFDLSDLLESNNIIYEKAEKGLVFNWKNPKRAFNNYDIKSGCIDLFFQLGNDDKCIVRVMDVSIDGFENFTATDLMSKEDFLEYVGLKNGECLPPCREDIADNEQYRKFREKYNITLNKQQERAMLAIEGSVLLLAVPGSGKTTVLVSRLGHMVINKNIAPENILAITYSNQAADEMRSRFSDQFGAHIGKRIDFRTINSLALKVYWDYCRKKRKQTRALIQDKDRRALIAQIYKKYNDEFAAESDIQNLSTAIECIKNMMLSDEQIVELESELQHLNAMFQDYQQYLKDKMLMDFDDQMVFALWILENDTDILNSLRNQYKYISVDEAQDTSKIQHAIIKLLAEGNSLFMVGDEDQSIYGFRGAYPRALLNFRYDYKNPYILRMERNYRSTKQIVDKAQGFISKNKGRYEKNMVAERGEGSEVHLVSVNSKEEQYMHLLNVAKNTTFDTAFLYRDNESAVVLVDLLTRNGIPFQHRKSEMNFFGNKVVKDIVAYLTLAIDEFNWRAFEQICNKGIIYLKKQQKEYAIKGCKYRHISVYDALEEQMQYVERQYQHRAGNFKMVMKAFGAVTTSKAIEGLLSAGYGKYLEEERLDVGKVDILQILAKQEPDIEKFLLRLKELEQIMQQELSASDDNKVILSTIHTSKGLEYDTVYMVDVYDGRFPSSRPNILSRSKDNANSEQEERRLFYVGITRAKNDLYLFEIKNQPSQYVDEMFPEVVEARHQKEMELKRKKEAENEAKRKRMEEERRRKQAEETAKRQRRIELQREQLMHEEEQRRMQREATLKLEEEKQCQAREKDRKHRYEYVKDSFVQQIKPITDYYGHRWIQCEICGEIKETHEFVEYGGQGHVNLGRCYSCAGRNKKQ